MALSTQQAHNTSAYKKTFYSEAVHKVLGEKGENDYLPVAFYDKNPPASG